MYAKILVVIALMAYSFSLEHYRVELKKENYYKSGNFFRAYNEVPTVLSLLIVGYVVTKTFSIAFTLITLAIGAFVIYRVTKQIPKEVK